LEWRTTGRACCCAGIHCSSCPTISPIKFIKVQITNKSWKEILLPKPMLIANKKMRIYSSASIEASPLLYVAFSIFFIIFLPRNYIPCHGINYFSLIRRNFSYCSPFCIFLHNFFWSSCDVPIVLAFLYWSNKFNRQVVYVHYWICNSYFNCTVLFYISTIFVIAQTNWNFI